MGSPQDGIIAFIRQEFALPVSFNHAGYEVPIGKPERGSLGCGVGTLETKR